MNTIETIAIFVGIFGILVGLGFLLTKKFKSKSVKSSMSDSTEENKENKTRVKIR